MLVDHLYIPLTIQWKLSCFPAIPCTTACGRCQPWAEITGCWLSGRPSAAVPSPVHHPPRSLRLPALLCRSHPLWTFLKLICWRKIFGTVLYYKTIARSTVHVLSPVITNMNGIAIIHWFTHALLLQIISAEGYLFLVAIQNKPEAFAIQLLQFFSSLVLL